MVEPAQIDQNLAPTPMDTPAGISEMPDTSDALQDADDADMAALPLESIVEAILFAARGPLKLQQIAHCMRSGTRKDAVRKAIDVLNAHYEETGRAFEIVEVAEKFQFMSRPEYALHIQELLGRKGEPDRRLSRAALDTLSIIAYKQPITRVDVETIRGVGCGPILRALIERGSIRVVGKKTDVLGHPLLYGTTEAFLQEFGLPSLEELPLVHELRQATGTRDPLPEPAGEQDPSHADGDPETDSDSMEDADADEDAEDEEDVDDEIEYDEEKDDEDDESDLDGDEDAED